MSQKNDAFTQNLLTWYHQHGRKNLPWQHNRTPYRVWISEIMLQQTQVATVIPYYERFMQSFPTVADLARADEDNVLHHWTGLGYYARARNLHKAARIVHEELGGEFPATVDALCELPGIGRSTAGAILSLGHGKPAVILDGNVKRVLTRYHTIEGWPGQTAVQKRLWEIATNHTPEQDCAAYTQAIMDLGATLCTRTRPACAICPVSEGCQGRITGRAGEFPHKKPKKALPVKATTMLLLHNRRDNTVLLQKRPAQGIWGGLWSFPEIDAPDQAADFLASHSRNDAEQAHANRQQWDTLRHTFSHYHLDITPLLLPLEQQSAWIGEDDRWHWYDLETPPALGLAAPVKKLLALLTP